MYVKKFWKDGSMTIPEAITLLDEVLRDLEYHHKGGIFNECDCIVAPSVEDLGALKLSLEALKLIPIMRQEYPKLWLPPLPGETKE